MNARVMLLVVVICGFMVMWNQDRHPERSASLWTLGHPQESISGKGTTHSNPIAAVEVSTESVETISERRDEQVAEIPEPDTYLPARAPAAPIRRPRVSEKKRAEEKSIAAETASSSSNSSFPVPDFLAPGEYRVVDNRGNVGLVSYTDPELIDHARSTGWPVKDFYEYREGARRLYYIRIDKKSNLLMAENSQKADSASEERNPEAEKAQGTREEYREAFKILRKGLGWTASCLREGVQSSSRSIGSGVSRLAEGTREWGRALVPVRLSFQDVRDWASRISSSDRDNRSL